jgi:tetratricopeptide (TPR) repeat protein
MSPDGDLPVVGASGAISGIMGAFLVRLGRRRIRFLWFPLPPLPWRKHFSMPAFVFLPLWFVSQLLMADVAQGRGGVAVYAHLGGFVFGAVAGILIAVTGVEKRFVHPAIEAQVGYSVDAEFLRAIEQGDQEDFENARATLARLLARDPKNVDVRRYALEVAFKSRDEAGVAAHGTRLLEMYLQLQEADLARDLIHETSSSRMPARFLLHAADFVLKEGDARTAIDLYRRAADDHPADPAALRALLQVSDLLRRAGDPAGARAALDRGLRHPGCVGEWKDTFARKLSQLPAASSRPGAMPGSRPFA